MNSKDYWREQDLQGSALSEAEHSESNFAFAEAKSQSRRQKRFAKAKTDKSNRANKIESRFR